jgi:hypothetical protein
MRALHVYTWSWADAQARSPLHTWPRYSQLAESFRLCNWPPLPLPPKLLMAIRPAATPGTHRNTAPGAPLLAPTDVAAAAAATNMPSPIEHRESGLFHGNILVPHLLKVATPAT